MYESDYFCSRFFVADIDRMTLAVGYLLQINRDERFIIKNKLVQQITKNACN